MKRKQHSGVFMMEMIMVVFFFIICASICILVFVRGDRMSREASDLNQSVLIAQSVAEIWKAEGIDGLTERFGAETGTGIETGAGTETGENGGETYFMEFDKNGEPSGPDEGVYTAKLSADGTAGRAEIELSREGVSVYTLAVSRHETEQE